MSSFSEPKVSSDDAASQRGLVREIEYSIETLKAKMIEKLDAIKNSSVRQVYEGSQRSQKAQDASGFNTDALKVFEKCLTREMEGLLQGMVNVGRRFSPSIVDTIEVPASIGFNYGANVYNEKHNMIISCPSNSYMHFYDASEMTQMKQRRRKQLSSSVVQMSYNADTDTHLMGCAFGDIYSYDAARNNLTKIMKQGDSFVLAITHVNANTFAFSSSKSGKLFFGDMNGGTAVPHHSKDSDAWYLYNVSEKNLLFSGLANGKIAIYDTKKPNFPMVESLQAHRFGKYVTAITRVMINGKEYMVTGGNDHTIKIWQMMRGKMRLVKVIQNSEDVSTIVYLEEYKMIATTHHKDYIKFFSLPFGKLEAKLELGLTKARNIFLMKDKNLLGVADLTKNHIKVVQLHATNEEVAQLR